MRPKEDRHCLKLSNRPKRTAIPRIIPPRRPSPTSPRRRRKSAAKAKAVAVGGGKYGHSAQHLLAQMRTVPRCNPARVRDRGISLPAARMRTGPYEEYMLKIAAGIAQGAALGRAESGERIVMLFEGSDAAGKGRTIKPSPGAHEPAHRPRGGATEADRARAALQWFFQRGTFELPSACGTASLSTAPGTTAPASSG